MASKTRQALNLGHTDPGFLCFAIKRQAETPRTRRRFSTQRRKEVSIVRKRRACLRCRLLKIPCSGDDPCSTCIKLASSVEEKRILRFSDCIRTSLKDVNIFQNAIPPLYERDAVFTKTHDLASASITLSFASQVTWDLEALTNDIMKWLKDSSDSNTSKVGTLSSPQFLDLIQSFVGSNAALSFQRMLHAESLSYTQPTASDKHCLSVLELQQIGAVAGHDFLLELDRKLSPQVLASCSKEGLQALFLLVFGTILAVGYTVPATESPVFTLNKQKNGAAIQEQTLYDVMQEHLCRMLAHYLLYIGRKLGLQIPDHIERVLLDAAHRRWEKEGLFLWLTENGEEIDETEHWIDEYNYLTTTELDTFPEIISADWTSPLFWNHYIAEPFSTNDIEFSDFTAAIMPASIAFNPALDIYSSGRILDSLYSGASDLTEYQSVSSINAPQTRSWANNLELEYPYPGDNGSAMTEMFDLCRPAAQLDLSIASTPSSGRKRGQALTPLMRPKANKILRLRRCVRTHKIQCDYYASDRSRCTLRAIASKLNIITPSTYIHISQEPLAPPSGQDRPFRDQNNMFGTSVNLNLDNGHLNSAQAMLNNQVSCSAGAICVGHVPGEYASRFPISYTSRSFGADRDPTMQNLLV